jgi:hypothetical protein
LALRVWRVLAFKFAEQASSSVVRVGPAANRRIQDPPDSGAHLAAAKGLPAAGSTWCAHPLKTGVEIRSLAAYDTALGIVGAKGRWRDGGHEIGDS